MRSRSVIFWIVAFSITVVSAVYQRVSGPTYPLHGTVDVNGKSIEYTLDRSHGGKSNHAVRIETHDGTMTGTLMWKRFKMNEM